MKLVIRTVSNWNNPNLRTWNPDNPNVVAEEITIRIGTRESKPDDADEFSIRIATPAGLATLDSERGIVAVCPLLVIDRYDFDFLFAWLTETVESCEARTWSECVQKLELHFNWCEWGLRASSGNKNCFLDQGPSRTGESSLDDHRSTFVCMR